MIPSPSMIAVASADKGGHRLACSLRSIRCPGASQDEQVTQMDVGKTLSCRRYSNDRGEIAMKATNRRQFLKRTGTVIAGAAALATGGSHAIGANDRIVLGVIGPGGQGSGLLKSFAAPKDVEVAYVCDPDSPRMNAAAEAVESATGKAPRVEKDMRRIFENKSVDAVVIATPDHWHAPATILACDAGKHVYVEKPCSHNIREGRLMIEAARRNKRVVQVDR